MSRTLQIVGVTAAAAAGVVLGAILFRTPTPEQLPVPRPAPADARPATADLALANDRIAALETQLRALQEKVDARGLDKESLLKALREEWVAEARSVVELPAAEADERPFGWRVPNRPESVASLLGLDAARRKTLEETYRAFVERIRRLEKEHARTTVDGNTTRIEIAAFPVQGMALIDEWVAQLGTILTPDEREKYKKMSLGLLPADVGQHERIIAIVTEPDGTASTTEHSTHGGSASYKGPKEGAIAPYGHLLKK